MLRLLPNVWFKHTGCAFRTPLSIEKSNGSGGWGPIHIEFISRVVISGWCLKNNGKNMKLIDTRSWERAIRFGLFYDRNGYKSSLIVSLETNEMLFKFTHVGQPTFAVSSFSELSVMALCRCIWENWETLLTAFSLRSAHTLIIIYCIMIISLTRLLPFMKSTRSFILWMNREKKKQQCTQQQALNVSTLAMSN